MSDLPSTAFGVLKLLPTSKDEINRFSVQLINQVKNGELNPLELKAYFKKLEAVIEIVDKHTKEHQLNEAEKYPEKAFDLFGCKIEKSELGTKYDYASTGDYEWGELDIDVKSAERKRKDREAFLRSIKHPETIVYERTGEVITVKPPAKKSETGLKFHIK